jgi:GTP:adenosylcobinamide-phosphate guanylyltransferase
MDTQKVATKYRLAQWAQVIQAQQESGQNIKNIVPSGWMQLTSKQAQHAKEAMVIEINSCHVMVNAQTDLELLKKICLTLMSLK